MVSEKRSLIFIFLLFFLLLANIICSQDYPYSLTERISRYSEFIDADKFDKSLLADAILYELDKELKHIEEKSQNYDSVLSKAAYDYAVQMATAMDAVQGLGGKKMTLISRLNKYGYSGRLCEELLIKTSFKNGKELMTFQQLAGDIVFKWFNNAKTAEILKNDEFVLVGTGAEIDAEKKENLCLSYFGKLSCL